MRKEYTVCEGLVAGADGSEFKAERYLTPAVRRVFATLESAGYQVYLVGGSLRDMLLGKEVHDYDFATDATPEEVMNVFQGERVIPTGMAHGTVTVILDNQPFEITTFRLETTYSDHRHPDGVIFASNLEDDLARRDFTVNALAYNPACGLTDLYGGLHDLLCGTVKAVGLPEERFREDALRILRALRFASCLQFAIEPATAAAAREAFPTLSYVARERIVAEMDKLLTGKAALAVLRAFPELWQAAFADVFEHITSLLGGDVAACVIPDCELASACSSSADFELSPGIHVHFNAGFLQDFAILSGEAYEDVRTFVAEFAAELGVGADAGTGAGNLADAAFAGEEQEFRLTFLWLTFLVNLFAAAKLDAASYKIRKLAADLRFSNYRRKILEAVLVKLTPASWLQADTVAPYFAAMTTAGDMSCEHSGQVTETPDNVEQRLEETPRNFAHRFAEMPLYEEHSSQQLTETPLYTKRQREQAAELLVRYGLYDCIVASAFYAVFDEKMEPYRNVFRDFKKSNLPLSLKALALDGRRLLELRQDISGKQIKAALEAAWLAVLRGEIANKPENLATFCNNLVL